jgi:hypothetical protein
MNRVTIVILALTVLLLGPTASAQADTATQLPFSTGRVAWLAVDPAAGHVFVSGGAGTSSIVVLDYAGQIVKTISGEGGASQMVLDGATHTLYVALHDATAISEIDTQTLSETKRFSTAPYPSPTSLVIAGGKLWFSCANGNSGCLVSANLDGTGMATPISGGIFPLFLAAGGTNNHLLAFGYSEDEPPSLYVYDVSGSTPSQVGYSFAPNGDSADIADMAFDPTGDNLLLATGAPYFIQSLTTATLTPSADYPTGPYPVALAVTANGKFVAGGVNTGTGAGNDIFVYPTGSTTPVRTWALGSGVPGLLDHSLAFTPDASRLFAVTNGSAGHLVFNVLSQPTVPLKASSTALTRLSPSRGTVRYGNHASLKVKVTGPTSGKVDLYATTSSATKQLVATASLSSGTATFSVTPKMKTTYSAELEQGADYLASTSHDVTISVAPIASIGARADRVAPYRGHRARRILLTGRVKPARVNQALGFVVQRLVGKSWRTAASGTFSIEGDGAAHVFFFTNRGAQYRVRVQYAGDSDYTHATSPWKKFRTRKIR